MKKNQDPYVYANKHYLKSINGQSFMTGSNNQIAYIGGQTIMPSMP